MCCDIKSIGNRVGPEKYPRKTSERERHRDAQHRVKMGKRGDFIQSKEPDYALPEGFGNSFDDQIKTVQRSPNDKGPVGAVPQATEKEHDKNIAIGFHRAMMTAPEREIHIISQP